MLDPKVSTLLTVYELGSFTKAAEALSLTQPAVSQHIKQLEKSLGIKIFVRGENKLKLTSEGEVILLFAQRMRDLCDNMKQTLKDQARHISRLSVGLTRTAEMNIMADVLAKYCNEQDNVRFKIITDSIGNLYDMLKTYKIDIAIVEGHIPENNFNHITLDTDYLALAVSNDNPLAKKDIVTLPELQQQKMILRLPDSSTRSIFISYLESNNMSIDDMNVILEVDNIATIKDFVKNNFGVSILAKSTCLEELKKGMLTLLPVENLTMSREMNIVYHKDFVHQDILVDVTKMYYEAVNRYK